LEQSRAALRTTLAYLDREFASSAPLTAQQLGAVGNIFVRVDSLLGRAQQAAADYVRESAQQAQAEARGNLWSHGVVAVLAALLAGLVAFALARSLRRPLRAVHDGVERIRGG